MTKNKSYLLPILAFLLAGIFNVAAGPCGTSQAAKSDIVECPVCEMTSWNEFVLCVWAYDAQCQNVPGQTSPTTVTGERRDAICWPLFGCGSYGDPFGVSDDFYLKETDFCPTT